VRLRRHSVLNLKEIHAALTMSCTYVESKSYRRPSSPSPRRSSTTKT